MTATQVGPATEAGRTITQWAEIGDGSITRLVVECEQEAAAVEARRTIDVLRPFLTHADDCGLPRSRYFQNFCDCGLDARLAAEGVPA